jgi:hypothetical protein
MEPPAAKRKKRYKYHEDENAAGPSREQRSKQHDDASPGPSQQRQKDRKNGQGRGYRERY